MIPLPSLSDSIDPVRTALDATPGDAKLNWMHGLAKKELVALWRLTEGEEVPLGYYHGGEDEIVVHEGQNSLLAFTTFQKRIVLRRGKVQGYNRQNMNWLVGPGHFMVEGDESSSFFDYTAPIPEPPTEFPPVKPNEAGFSRFVYAGLTDKVRRIASDCVIGAAFRRGKQTGDYFMLLKR